MATRVHALAVHVVDRYDGDAARVWTTAASPTSCARTSTGCPGYGTMKIKALGSVLFKRFGVELAEPLIPWHPDAWATSTPPQALTDYQASKKAQQGLVGSLTAEHGERALARLLAVAVGL